MTYRELRELKEDGANIILLCGNHDQNMRVGDITSLEALSEFVTVVSKPVSYGIFDWIPYTADPESFRNAFANCRGEILFLHQPIKEAIPGATNLTGKTIVLGADFDTQQHKLILSGDIHKRQTLLGGRFQYLGSPLQLTFGDRGEQRGFTILDTATLEMEFIESDAPKFYWFRYDFKEHPSIDFDRDFVRFSYLAESEEVGFLKAKYPRVQFDKLREGLDAMESAPQIELLTDDRKLLEEYMDRVGIGDLDRERLLAVGLQELSGATI
jgi:DNA repair exonuclease SbcCD nuclease subunit